MKVILYSITAFVVLTFAFACSEVSLVGSDLFVPDSIELLFEEDFEINASTERVDSIVTWETNVAINSFIVGELVDPAFGQTIGEGYVDLRFGPSTAGGLVSPKFVYQKNGVDTKVTLDSVVLVLEYNQEGFYGDSLAAHNMEIHLLDEALPREDTIFSTYRPSAERLIGSKTFVPTPNDSLYILVPQDTILTAIVNSLRIRLDDEWVQAMIDDTSLVGSTTSFLDYAPGIKISSKPERSSTIGFDMAVQNNIAPDNNIYIYYTDTLAKSYRFAANGLRHNFYQHNYESGDVSMFIGDQEKGDELLFLQGMAGVEIDLEIPVLGSNQFDNFIVNQAELEFFVLEDASSDIFDPIENIIIQEIDEDGEFLPIEDVFITFETGNTILFGGGLETVTLNGMTLKKYNAKMTVNTIQRLRATEKDIRLRIAPSLKTIIPNRSIIYGPKHPDYPMKLKVSYSN